MKIIMPPLPGIAIVCILAATNFEMSHVNPIVAKKWYIASPIFLFQTGANSQSIPGVPNNRISIFFAAHLQCRKDKGEGGGREMLHLLFNKGFPMGMLQIKHFHLIR